MTHNTESVATVLERELKPLIGRWLKRVEGVPALTKIKLSDKERTGHLPQLIKDLIFRLRLEEGTDSAETSSAHEHGEVRFKQGYSVPMLVEESRLLQVSIFDTLRRNQMKLDPDLMMAGVIIIADECDLQLQHTVETFMDLELKGKKSRVA